VARTIGTFCSRHQAANTRNGSSSTIVLYRKGRDPGQDKIRFLRTEVPRLIAADSLHPDQLAFQDDRHASKARKPPIACPP
jgi:hypothetical protein